MRSVLGNDAAMDLLAKDNAFDFVVLCQAADYAERSRMVMWLKASFPSLPVVSIHSVFEDPVKAADVSVPVGQPGELLRVLQDKFTGTQPLP